MTVIDTDIYGEGVTVERVGATILRREHCPSVITDRYRVETKHPDVGHDEWFFDAIRIGCPRCKQNMKARLRGGTYHCPCGYSDTFNGGISLRQAARHTEQNTHGEVVHKDR